MRGTALLSIAGQSVWLDNITRTLLDSGTLERYVRELSVTGLTSNPSIFEKAVTGGDSYDAQIRGLMGKGMKPEEIFFEIALTDLRRACDLFAPIHARTGGEDGWVSLEVSPLLANDTDSTVKQALALHAKASRKNLFIKVPGTPEGIPAIESLTADGVSINVTLLFSDAQYRAAAEAYMRGLERRAKAGQPLDGVCGVASLFISRWDGKTAKRLPATLANTLGIAVGRQCYRSYVELFTSERWMALAAKGARPQRLLFASTSTKDPALKDTLYVESLAAPRTVDTIPEHTLLAMADHGTVDSVLSPTDTSWKATLDAVTKAGIDLDATAQTLQVEGRDSFDKSWNDLIACIDSKAAALA
jgi:transaldolase